MVVITQAALYADPEGCLEFQWIVSRDNDEERGGGFVCSVVSTPHTIKVTRGSAIPMLIHISNCSM